MALERGDFDLLASMPLFSSLSQDVLERFIGESRPKAYSRGQVVFEAGMPAERFYVILDGWVKLCRHSFDGQEIVVRVLTRGETFAEAVMFMRAVYPLTAEVIHESRLLHFEFATVAAVMREEPELAFGMLASTSLHLKKLVEQIEQIKGLTGPKRVGDFILNLCPQYEGSAVIGLPYEKALIAARLGMKPESFSRALARLRKLGVRTERGHVIVSDIRKLSAYINQDDELDRDWKP